MVTSPISSPVQQAYTAPLQQKIDNQTRNPDPRPEDSAQQPQASGANAAENAQAPSETANTNNQAQQFSLPAENSSSTEQQAGGQQERGSLLDVTV